MAINEKSVQIEFPSTAAGTAEERYVVWPFHGVWRIKSVMFAPATAVATDGTNYTTGTVTQNDGAAGADSSAVASHTTNTSGGVALVLKTTLDLTVTQRGDLQRGHQIKVAKTNAGTGAILDGTYTVVAEKLN